MTTKTTIEVRGGGTAYGTVIRRVRVIREKHRATIGGFSLMVHDPHGACYVYVHALHVPRDLDTRGYG
jgi:hypothetical protein